ncbi:MAG: hypothetical protein HYR63_22585 [Proteobacteria bacterium]|nr:hypothetical protein [Pseudomonadota bacterium]MBI3497635.1 hypothetical protein [Pseudomonadota bacterium]
MRQALIIVATGLALSACQPLPQPFMDDHKEANPLLKLADRGGVVVLPIEGAPEPNELARAVAAQLQRLDVPASTIRTTREAKSLAGTAKARLFDGERDEIELDWRLLDASGKALGGDSGRWLVPRVAWQQSEPGVLLGMALAVGPSLNRLIEAGRPNDTSGSARVVVYPVDGAPGDGRTALKRAMERALQRRSINIATEADDGTVVVLGSVTITAAASGQERVAVSWSVIDHEGLSLGVIDQENTQRAGLLDGPWGDVAVAIADAAAGGLAEIMQALSARIPD